MIHEDIRVNPCLSVAQLSRRVVRLFPSVDQSLDDGFCLWHRPDERSVLTYLYCQSYLPADLLPLLCG
jgi:hypothetical protein